MPKQAKTMVSIKAMKVAAVYMVQGNTRFWD